jgi:hypothetical protein
VATEGRSGYPRGSPAIPYDWAKEKLALQHAQIDGLDAKLANAFGFGSALWVVAAAFLALRSTDVSPVTIGFLAASGLVYLALVAISYFGYRIRGDWSFGPTFESVRDLADEEEDVKVTWTVAIAINGEYRKNESKVSKKGTWADWALKLLAAETVLLTVGLLTSLA